MDTTILMIIFNDSDKHDYDGVWLMVSLERFFIMQSNTVTIRDEHVTYDISEFNKTFIGQQHLFHFIAS